MSKAQTTSTKTGSKNVPKGTRQVAAGTFDKVGPKGAKLEEVPEAEVPEEQRQGERRQQQADHAMQFAVGQLTTPASHPVALTAEQVKQREFDAAVAKLAADMGVAAPVVKKVATRADKITRNNVVRPGAGTITGKVWDAADAISRETGVAAPIAAVKAHSTLVGVNEHTIKTQYARWRGFNGFVGRLPTLPKQTGSGVIVTHEGNP